MTRELFPEPPDDGPYFNVLAMCLSCKNKWIGTVEARVSLFKLQCPACKATDSFASFIPEEYGAQFLGGPLEPEELEQ